MRAMILAAGFGTRLRPLTNLRAKPALPVAGRPVIAFLLELLVRHGVDEVLINLHHLPETIEAAVEAFCPPGLSITYQYENQPLGTGGGIAQARAFLSESDPAFVLAGDMLLDADLSELARAHTAKGDLCTLVLRRDPRSEQFGTIGVDDTGRVRRIAQRFDLGGEADAGVFLGVRIVSPGFFDLLPPNAAQDAKFEDLSDWIAPALSAGERRIAGQVLEAEACTWVPVGTPVEYLRANLDPPRLSFLSPDAFAAPGTQTHSGTNVILGTNARLPETARLNRSVVWADEVVPEHFKASEGVFAGGTFYACSDAPSLDSADRAKEGTGHE
jgi:NDP-sugar pyrophosphorylase family protein